MAAISSAADGTWIVGAAVTWVGGIAPTEGDTATVLGPHDVEIDGNITVGADTATAAIQVNSSGRLFVPSTVAGSYTLICKGDFKTDGTGGTIEIGTVANPIPVGTTFTIKLNYSASLSDGEFGLLIAAGGTFTCQGSDCWSSGLTDPDRCLLATDEAVNSTAWTTDGATAWDANDYIAIAPTGTTYSQYEIGQVDSVVGTTLNVKSFGGAGGGLAYAHTGTDADVRAEIINLTRNVVIQNYDGVIGTPGAVSYVSFATTAVVDVDWTEFRYMGENASGKYGVVINTTSGSCNLNRCSFHHFEDGGVEVSGTSANNFTIQNCVGYLLSNLANRGGLRISATTNADWTASNICLIGTGTLQTGFMYFNSLLGTVSSLRVSGVNNSGLYISTSPALRGSITDLNAHSCSGYGVLLSGYYNTISNLKAWHNGGAGISLTGGPSTLNSPELYGNVNYNIFMEGAAFQCIFDSLKSSGTSYQATTYGLGSINAAIEFTFYNPEFSYVAGVRVAHSYDIMTGGITSIYLNNPYFGGTTAYIRFQNGYLDSFVQSFNYNQTAGDHRTNVNNLLTSNNYGSIIQTDQSYYRTAAPSCKMTPTSATYKLESGVMQIPVASGANPTVSVYLRKSAAYNGNQPRLIVKRNDALGITADTVMATFAGAVDVDTPPGTFTQLSGQPGAVSANGVIEVYVDCDGTAGYINIDDWTVTGNI